MIVGLISDTHIPESRDVLWPQVYEAFSTVDCILHAGDIYDIGVIEQLSEIAPTYAARGNGDEGSGGRDPQPEHPSVKESWLIELNGFKIGVTHYIPMPPIPPKLTPQNWIKKLFPQASPDVVIYGDTHVEQIDHFDGILCVNPGSPTLPHNLNTQLGTIGMLDLSGTSPTASIHQLTAEGIEPFQWELSRRPW